MARRGRRPTASVALYHLEWPMLLLEHVPLLRSDSMESAIRTVEKSGVGMPKPSSVPRYVWLSYFTFVDFEFCNTELEYITLVKFAFRL
ncbi:MAG TPA: hypothetical protein VIH59_09775 [Candidatus Tectomicrobia bacterium]|jgi:hypothetical protein